MELRKRKDGLWTTQVRVSKGKYKSVYAKTKRECERKAKELLVEVETGEYVPNTHMTLSQLWDKWRGIREPLLKESSMRSYERIWRVDVEPVFGDAELTDIESDDLQMWVNGMIGKYKPMTIHGRIKIVSILFNYAVKSGITKSNPCQGVTVPKRKSRRMSVLDSTEFEGFLDAFGDNSEHREFCEFLLLTGLRVGEALGATVGQYDKANGTLVVDRQFSLNVRKITTPKSGNAREIRLCARARKIVEGNSGGKGSGEFIFGDGSTPMTYILLYRRFKKAAEDIGRPELRIHDLRHSFATAAIKAGVDVKTLQETLGHADAGMTLNLYSHSSEDMKKAAADKLDDLFGK